MRLVPRQLQRHGMTGRVPYYGGRLTPDQAYAAAHPTSPPPPRSWTPRFGSAAPPTPSAPSPPPESVPLRHPEVPQRSRDEQLAILQVLRDTGVLTDDELAALREQVMS